MSEDYYKTLIKNIIETNDKEEAIKIIANKLNEKQISNEKEMLTNLDKDKEIEKLREETLLLRASEPMSKLTEDYGYKAEVERLNNIINELVKFMDEDYEYYKKYGYAEQGHAMGQIRRIKNKLQELKGSDK